jgi:hypothetical protein
MFIDTISSRLIEPFRIGLIVALFATMIRTRAATAMPVPLAPCGQQAVQRLGLCRRAREPVEDDPPVQPPGLQPVAQHVDHHRVRHKPARRHDLPRRTSCRRPRLDRRAQEVAGGELD